MAAFSSILAWRIPWIEEPSRLHSMESQGVRHDFSLFLLSKEMHLIYEGCKRREDEGIL